MSRYDIVNRIRQLDPVADHLKILKLSTSYEFPWLGSRSLEFALFRTFAVPSISRLLDETGQFKRMGQRRYDDTGLLLAEITENGYESERGRAALRRMNRLHARFDISNEDYLYVLSTFIYEPIRWVNRFGWRAITENEQIAGYTFWYEVGRRMGIKDIPGSYEAFEAYNIAYERDNFHYSPSNHRVGMATINVFLNWYPVPLRPLMLEVTYALLDDPLREAFGFPRAHSSIHTSVHTGLKLIGWFQRHFMPPRTEPWLFTAQPSRTYPDGYQIEHLGPPDVPPDDVKRRAIRE